MKEIFKASEKCQELHIRDIDVLKYSFFLFLGEALCLLVWFWMDSQNDHLHYQMAMVDDDDLSFYYQCYINSWGYLTVNVYNTMLVCYGMVLAYQTRHIRYIAFRQSYVYSVIAALFFFTVIMVHPVYYCSVRFQYGTSPNLSVLIYAVSTLFLVSGTILLVFWYKMYLLFKFEADVLRKEFLIPRKVTIDTVHSMMEYSKQMEREREYSQQQCPPQNEQEQSLNASEFTLNGQYIAASPRRASLSRRGAGGMSNDGLRPRIWRGNIFRGSSPVDSVYQSGSCSVRETTITGTKADDEISDLGLDLDDHALSKDDVDRLRRMGWTIKPPRDR